MNHLYTMDTTVTSIESNDSPCILVASHISKADRILLLQETLISLIQQSYTAHIYVSISFETEDYRNQFVHTMHENNTLREFSDLYVFMRPNKTPQMRHYGLLFPEIDQKNYQWIFFCDDDDIYDKDRVKVFMEAKRDSSLVDTQLAGLYESTFGKHHREQRHEYWCYCVNIEILRKFYLVIHKYEDILHHQCCDVHFGEFLRRLDNNSESPFIRITQPLYHYRTENNSDSVTGKIKKLRTNWQYITPPIGDPMFAEYVILLDKFLYENIDFYLHDTYLRTLIGSSFDHILRDEFKEDYEILQFLDTVHVEKLKEYYDYVRGISNELYDVKI